MLTRLIDRRMFKDASLSGNVALPNAANTANTNSIDLGAAPLYPVNEDFQVKLEISTATGANSKNLTTTLQVSDDNASWSALAGGPSWVVANNGTAYAAASITVNLPPVGLKRYLRATTTGEANGGNAGDGTLTISAVF